MGKKLYVGNLTYGVTDSALEQMFQQTELEIVAFVAEELILQ